MYILTTAYSYYHMMRLHTACVKSVLTYEEAENLSQLMNSLFNTKTSADTFVKNPDDEANKALELYGLYKSVLDGLKEEEKIAIEEFCKVVYDDGEMPSLKVEGFIMYPIYLRALFCYVCGNCTFQQVKDSIVDLKPWYDKPKKIDSRHFRRDFLIMEELYNKIKDDALIRVNTK